MTRAATRTAARPAESARPREETAQRLLKGSARKSYAPVVDIDWDAPLEPDTFFLPPELVSIYGTDLWNSLTREQQIDLSRQELVNVLSAGIWFENILNQALLRDLMHRNPTAASSHYMLTELGDETRHMVMFGKAIDRIGGVPVRPRLYQRMIINMLPLAFRGPILWGAALVGEEIFDALQRRILEGADVQPIVLRLMRIHVTEEARHIQFARDDLRTTAPAMPWYRRLPVANLHGIGGPFYRFLLTHPAIYARAGLQPREARRVARSSAHFRQTCRDSAGPLTDFFTEIGLMGRLSRRMWRRSGFL